MTLQPYEGLVQGLGNLTVKGKGTVRYNISNDSGEIVSLIIANVYYVPKMNFRLISPQQVAKQSRDPKAGLKIRSSHCKFTWDNHIKTINFNETSRLPILYTSPGTDKVTQFYNNLPHFTTFIFAPFPKS